MQKKRVVEWRTGIQAVAFFPLRTTSSMNHYLAQFTAKLQTFANLTAEISSLALSP